MKLKIHKLTENIFSLLSLKGLQYIINFLLLPYILYILGATKYGAIIFVQSIVQYFVIIVDYGFNLTGPKDIAKLTDPYKIRYKFTAIITTKISIMFVITTIFIILNYCFNILSTYESKNLFLASYLLVVGNILFPIWFFQGIQQMKYITIINFFAKCIVVSLIFILVKKPEDYILAALLLSGENIISGFFAIYIIIKKYKNILIVPNAKMIKRELINGWSLFVSTVAINIYTTTNIVLLGLITNTTIVGYFSAANKIIDGIKGAMFSVTQAVYPYISELLKKSKEQTLIFIKQFCRIYVSSCFILSILLFCTAKIIVNLLFGSGYEATTKIFYILSFLPFVISISNVYGIQIMINFGKQKIFSKILFMACILDCLAIYPMVYYYDGIGVAIVMLFAELFITICCLLYVKYKLKFGLF